jgi:hypothetical protein
VDLWLRNPADASKPYRLTLLVQDRLHLNLTRLSPGLPGGAAPGHPPGGAGLGGWGGERAIALSGGVEDVAHALFR